MYLDMYGFSEKPFHITPNPRFIFLSKNHKEAFAHLLYGIQQRVGFLSLSGEIGTGKTTVLRTLLGQLDDEEYRVALIFNPCLNSIELLQTIHREFSIGYDREQANMVELFDSLNHFLLEQRKDGRTVVLVIDEAQNLDPKVLEQLRLLSNLETETEKLIQLVLVGQPELDDILQRKDLRQLRQRLAVSYRLEAMDAEDTRTYVLHRLKVAGNRDRDLFTEPALAQVYRLTRGTPRLVNILCDRALLVAYARDAHKVSKADVQTAQKELQHQQKQARTSHKTFVVLGFVGLVLCILAARLLLSAPLPIGMTVNLEDQTAIPVAKVDISESVPDINEPAGEKELYQPEIDTNLVELYKRRIIDMSIEETGLESAKRFADSWQHVMPKPVPVINNRRLMVNSLQALDLYVVKYDGDLESLLQFDVPVILEIVLPGVVQKRFLALLEHQKGKVRLWPQVSEDGWVTLDELKMFWFGNALLAYRNFESIPMLDRPGQEGTAVVALQELLVRNGSDAVVMSGKYDQQTIAAVADFQRKKQLAPDGRVGAYTLFWLYRGAGYAMPRLTTEVAQ